MRRRTFVVIVTLAFVVSPMLAAAEADPPRLNALSWLLDVFDLLAAPDGVGPGADPDGLTAPPAGTEGEVGPGADPDGLVAPPPSTAPDVAGPGADPNG